ncbi:hypothetical protein SMKC034_44360 [Serratia marcescens]|nr:hypothetical protein SMKC034_44360 [Serratia marcescens]
MLKRIYVRLFVNCWMISIYKIYGRYVAAILLKFIPSKLTSG